RELGVDYVLEGSVRRSEDRIRVSAQLIHVTDQTHVWAEKYDAALRDTIKTQSEVAEAVAAQMRIVLPLEEGRPRRAHPLDPDAYETYLRGLYYYGWGEPDGFRKAIECFRETIAKDPAYAPAYARMALAHIFSAFFGFARPADAYPMAQAAARKALELDDTLGEAHTVLGRFRWFHSWDFATAQVELERGVELAPNDPTAHWSLAIFLSVIREDQDAAAHQIALARELDPLSIGVRLAAGWRLYFARHHEHAMQYSRETLGMYEKSLHAWYVLGLAALAQGSFAEATATFEQAVQVFGDPFSAAWLGLVYGSAGEHEKACAMLGWLDQAAAGRHVPAICRAWIHMGLGNNDAAFDWLQKAYSEHDAQLLWMRVTPFYDPLRGEPRFQKLIARLNLPPIG
ncbi:MAG: hypothetical protein HY820_32715, partial [Acidobacteria bacterium]|nr:hypothetical protein [Acidobacteriota bacterium]